MDADGICDDVDPCVGAYDECGVCNGPVLSTSVDARTFPKETVTVMVTNSTNKIAETARLMQTATDL